MDFAKGLLRDGKEFQVRRYEITDYKRVKEVLQRTGLFFLPMDSEESLVALNQSASSGIFLLTHAKHIISCCYVTGIGSNFAMIWRAATHPEWQKQGAMKALYGWIRRMLQERGSEHVSCFILTSNTDAQVAWQHMGMLPGLDHTFYYEGIGKRKKLNA